MAMMQWQMCNKTVCPGRQCTQERLFGGCATLNHGCYDHAVCIDMERGGLAAGMWSEWLWYQMPRAQVVLDHVRARRCTCPQEKLISEATLRGYPFYPMLTSIGPMRNVQSPNTPAT